MNKTTIKVLQELLRNNDFLVNSLAQKLRKAKTTIYDCFRTLRMAQLLNKDNQLLDNELVQAYKLLFLTYPYDFSFLTKNNLKILINLPLSFTELIKKTKLSRFTVNQLLRQLKNRGFINKQNKIIFPPELINLIDVLSKEQFSLNLPATAVIIYKDKEHAIIRATLETVLPLKKTAFSAFNVKILSPHNYYSTKKRITAQDIFDDAKTISKDKKERLLVALFYYFNKKKLKKDNYYEEIIRSNEFIEYKQHAQ